MKVRTKFLLSGVIILVVAIVSQYNSSLLLGLTNSFSSGIQASSTGTSPNEGTQNLEASSTVLRLGFFQI